MVGAGICGGGGTTGGGGTGKGEVAPGPIGSAGIDGAEGQVMPTGRTVPGWAGVCAVSASARRYVGCSDTTFCRTFALAD